MVLCRRVCLDWLYKGHNSNSVVKFDNNHDEETEETLFLFKDIIQFYRVEQINIWMWDISMNSIMSNLRFFCKLKHVCLHSKTNKINNKNNEYCENIITQMFKTNSNSIEELWISADLPTKQGLIMHNLCKLTVTYCAFSFISFGTLLRHFCVEEINIDLKFWYYLSHSHLSNLETLYICMVSEMYPDTPSTMKTLNSLVNQVATNLSPKLHTIYYSHSSYGTDNCKSLKSPKLQFLSKISQLYHNDIQELLISLTSRDLQLTLDDSITAKYNDCQFGSIKEFDMSLETDMNDKQQGILTMLPEVVNFSQIVTNIMFNGLKFNINKLSLELFSDISYAYSLFQKINSIKFEHACVKNIYVSCDYVFNKIPNTNTLSMSGVAQFMQEFCCFLAHLEKIYNNPVGIVTDHTQQSTSMLESVQIFLHIDNDARIPSLEPIVLQDTYGKEEHKATDMILKTIKTIKQLNC